MLRKSSRNVPAKNTRSARLNLESLEPRQMLSASSFTTDFTRLSTAVNKAGTSTNSGYTPSQIRTAYGFNSASFGSTAANGAGETIAIIDAYNDPTIASDLATFDAAYGIAAPPSFTVVNQSGGSSLPSTDPSAGWEVEESLDVEWAHAIAPGANIILVEASSASDTNLFDAVNYARNLSNVSVISMSWGSDDSSADASTDQALSSEYLVTPSGHQGITFVASSGDDGHPNFPAESPNVLAVGGTDLYLNSNGTISSETAWEPQNSGGEEYSGGGGVSVEFPGRDVPDVSYDAGVGYAIYDSFDGTGGWIDVGGTSAGAPQWAALVAIADQGRALAGLGTLGTTNNASQVRAAVFAAPSSDFHDITVGSTEYESAGPGYDLATGLGTPVANQLISYLASYNGSGTTTGGGGGTTTTAPSAPTNFTASAVSTSQINLSWTDSSGATGYKVYELENGSAVLIDTLGSTATSVSVTGLSASTSYSFEVSAYNSAGAGTTAWDSATTQAAATTNKITAPTNVSVVATSSTTATLSWSAVSGATGYYVYERTNSGSVVGIGSVSSTTTSVTISGLTAGATESFFVDAYNATSAASSGWVSVVMPKAATLTAPTNVTATATSSTTGTLSWTGSSGATQYAIYYWNGRQAIYLGSVSSSTTSVTITGLPAGATTEFEVVAENSTSSAASGWVNLTTPSAAAKTAALDYLFGSSTSNKSGWVA